MLKNKSWIIPSVLFLFSLFLRLSLVSKGPYHVDCLGFAAAIAQSWENHKIYFLHGHGYPLTAIIGTAFWGIAQLFHCLDPVMAVNLMSVVLSSICLLPLYFWIRRTFDQSTAVFSTLLFSVSPIFLSVSTYGNSHIPFLFFLFSALLSLTQFRITPLPRYLYLGAILLGLAGAARLQDLAVLAIPLGYLFFVTVNNPTTDNPRQITKDLIKLITAALTTVLVIAFFYALVYLARPAGYFQESFFRTQFSPFTGPLSPALMTSLGYLQANFKFTGIAVSVTGIILMAKNSRPVAFFLLLWFLCPLLILGNFDTAEPRFILAATIPLAIFQGFFLATLFKNPASSVRMTAITICLFLISVYCLTIFPVLSYRHRHNLNGDYAQWVAAQTEPDSRIIVGDEGFFVSYYGKRSVIPQFSSDLAYLGTPKKFRAELRSYKKQLNDLLEQGIPVYITEIGLFSNNDGLFYEFISRYYDITYVGKAPFELWQRSDITQRIRWIKLFKLTKKKPLL